MKRITAENLSYAAKPRRPLPKWFTHFDFNGAKKRYAEGKEGQMVSHYASIGDIVVCLSVMQVSNAGCCFRVHRHVSGIHISLHGEIIASSAESTWTVCENVVSFFGFSPGTFDVVCKTGEYACLDVFYPQAVVLKYRHLLSIANDTDLHGRFRSVTSPILDIVHCIQNCVFKGHARKSYLHLKVHELLLSVAALYEQTKGQTANLSSDMLAKMEKVQAFLAANYTSHFTIGELAKMFAVNTTTLKGNFHLVAGAGLYAFVLSRRMLKAKELVEHGALSITAIAYQVGYKSPGTFIRAFKKHFGYTPAHKHG